MEPFEFKIDTSTKYIKTFRALGFIAIGFALGATAVAFNSSESVDWVSFFILMSCGLGFAFFPGLAKMPELHFNEEGIFLKNYSYHWGEKKEITWDKISSIRVDRNQLSIKNSIGSTEKIKFPIYTKEQINNLRSYLKEVATEKEVEYLG